MCNYRPSKMASVTPRQQVNQICRPFGAQGRIVRARSTCPSCRSFKLVNSLSDASGAINAVVAGPPDNSLTAVISYFWVKNGRPSLTWDDLLQRTILADKELECKGHNPARSFRDSRLINNVEAMRTYIRGFYQYAFCPTGRPSLTPSPSQIPVVMTVPSPKNSDRVKTLFRMVEDVLDQLKPKDRFQDNATRINEMINKNLIPRPIGNLMHAIRIKRNEVEHDRYEPDMSVMAAIEAEWSAISSWWRQRSKSSSS